MKKFIRRVVVVYTFTNMFNIGPHKSCPLTSTPVLNCCDLLFWLKYIKYMKKICPHTDRKFGKERSTLTAFSNNLIHTIVQNLTGGSFLKVYLQ